LQDNESPNLEDALSSLASDVIEEEKFSSQQEIEINRINEAVNSETLPNTNVDSLRSQERTLLRIDRLLISGGIRFVLFLPLIVVVNFGLAHSYRNTTPEWWLEHMQEVAPVEMHLGIHFLSLFILVANIALLLLLFRLLTVTRKIFQHEAESLTTAGLTFKSSHGYAEMRATINGSRRQLGATISFLIFAILFLGAALWLAPDGDLSPSLVALSTGSLLAGHGTFLVSNKSIFLIFFRSIISLFKFLCQVNIFIFELLLILPIEIFSLFKALLY